MRRVAKQTKVYDTRCEQLTATSSRIVARKIIELRQRGVREAAQLMELAIKELGVE